MAIQRCFGGMTGPEARAAMQSASRRAEVGAAAFEKFAGGGKPQGGSGAKGQRLKENGAPSASGLWEGLQLRGAWAVGVWEREKGEGTNLSGVWGIEPFRVTVGFPAYRGPIRIGHWEFKCSRFLDRHSAVGIGFI